MRPIATRLEGPILLEPVVHGDPRGFFIETYRRSALAAVGVGEEFVQDNHSRSVRGVVRGMHYQKGMAKLVRCVRGAIFDVVVDLRIGSPAFGQWEGYELNDTNHHQFYCPDGFAHGFCVLSEVADVVYKTSRYWAPEDEGGFRYDDPTVAIGWPGAPSLIASMKDSAAPALGEIVDHLPFRYGLNRT